MNTERWQRVGDIFERLLEVPEDEREKRLASLCGDDQQLRGIVVSMLDSHESPARFSDASLNTLRDSSQAEAAASLRGEPLPRDSETEGARIGPWRLAGRIGAGGMGVVWLAERADGQFKQRAALKLIKRGMDSEAVLARFLRERQILARLEHRNIAHLLDGGIAPDGRPYFAMEYVEGLPLLAYCNEHHLKLEERLRLFLQVCTALRFAHAQHVVHRDIKPSNILVTADGSVKLLDFGIAKLLQGDDELTSTLTGTQREQPMTPAYAAPEQIAGGEVTEATDVYALGVVFYELLSGRRPHDFSAAADAHDVLKIILATDPVAPGRLKLASSPVPLKRLRGDLDTIALTALKQMPSRRYASVSALAADIENYLGGKAIAARRDHVFYRGYKFLLRHSSATAVIAASMLIAFLAMSWISTEKRAQSFADARAAVDLVAVDAGSAQTSVSASSTEIGRRMDLALSALHRYDPKGAIDELNNVLAMSAGYAPAYMYLAQALNLSGRETDALANAQHAADRSNGLSELQRLAIEHQLAVSKFEWSAALNISRKLLTLEPVSAERRFALARDLRMVGDFDGAEAALARWHELPDSSDDPRGDLEASSIANQRGHTKEAQKIAEIALRKALAQRAPGLAASARLAIVKTKSNLGERDGIEALLTDAVADYQHVGNIGGEAEVHSLRATILTTDRDLSGALTEYDRAMEAYQRIGNQRGMANVYGADATILWRQGVREGAITAAENMLSISAKISDASQQAYAAGILAFFRLDDSASDAVVGDFHRALDLADRAHDPRRKINTMRNYAEALRLRGDLRQAGEICSQAQTAADVLADPYYVQVVGLRCASIDRDRGEIERAKAEFTKAHTLAEKRGDDDSFAETELSIGQIEMGGGDCRSARLRFQSAAEKYSKAKNPVNEALALALLALCSSERKEIAEQARTLRSASTTRRDVFETDIALARLSTVPGSTQAARSKLRGLAEEAEKRRWLAYALEARLAEIQLLDKSRAREAVALTKQLSSDAKSNGFGWVLARLESRANTAP